MIDEEPEPFMHGLKTMTDEELKSLLHPSISMPSIYLLIVGELLLRHLKKDDERAKYITKSD